MPPKDVESDLRPISLTCTIAKVMEGFTCTRLLSQLNGKMDPRQYARRGHSTTDALLHICYKQSTRPLILVTLQLVYFLLNSVKGFDLIDHNILFIELRKLGVSEIILGWISAFLVDRRQAVSVGGTLSKWNTLRGGITPRNQIGSCPLCCDDK